MSPHVFVTPNIETLRIFGRALCWTALFFGVRLGISSSRIGKVGCRRGFKGEASHRLFQHVSINDMAMYQHNMQCTYDSIFIHYTNQCINEVKSIPRSLIPKHVFLRDPPKIEHPPLENLYFFKNIHEKAAWNSQDSFCHPSFTWSWWVFLRSPWNACWLVLQFLGVRKLSGKCLLDMQGKGGKTWDLDYGLIRHEMWYMCICIIRYTMYDILRTYIW